MTPLFDKQHIPWTDLHWLWLGAADSAAGGALIGQGLVWFGLIAGVWKCWSISRRSTTNAKCVLALMFVLLAFLVAAPVGAIKRIPTAGPVLAILVALLGLLMVALAVAPIVSDFLSGGQWAVSLRGHRSGSNPEQGPPYAP